MYVKMTAKKKNKPYRYFKIQYYYLSDLNGNFDNVFFIIILLKISTENFYNIELVKKILIKKFLKKFEDKTSDL